MENVFAVSFFQKNITCLLACLLAYLLRNLPKAAYKGL